MIISHTLQQHSSRDCSALSNTAISLTREIKFIEIENCKDIADPVPTTVRNLQNRIVELGNNAVGLERDHSSVVLITTI